MYSFFRTSFLVFLFAFLLPFFITCGGSLNPQGGDDSNHESPSGDNPSGDNPGDGGDPVSPPGTGPTTGNDPGSASVTACSTGALAAFPGAEGFGACATGGRGGQVIYVTNLNTSGSGSLQAALATSGKKYILFKVSGVIDGTVEMNRGDVTLAGQTSPGGIIVRGLDIQGDVVLEGDTDPLPAIYPQNFIIRHLRSRVSGRPVTSWVDEDGLRLHHAVNGIIDHFSSENATDEAVQISFSRDITIQNSILAETIGGHADRGGMLMNYSDPTRGFPLDRFSIHHNIWNRVMGRLPEISRENPSAANTTMNIELANNLLWDPDYFIDVAHRTGLNDTDPPVYYAMNWIGNFAQVRSGFIYGMMHLPINNPNSTATYFNDNHMNLYSSRSDYQLLYCCNDFPIFTPAATLPAYARSTRHDFPAITYHASSQLRDYMLTYAGAFPRDAMDLRLMDPVRTGVFDATPRNANTRGDAFSISNSTSVAPLDTDNDGMPDTWETAHGLNPNVSNTNGLELSSNSSNGIRGCIAGYTNLECYLNELAFLRVEGR